MIQNNEPSAEPSEQPKESSQDNGGGLAPTSEVSTSKEGGDANRKKRICLQKRYPFFWDLKASHWFEFLLSACIAGFAGLQWHVYERQAGIMQTQATIMGNQVKETAAENRPFVNLDGFTANTVRVGKTGPYISSIIARWSNDGTMPTAHFSYSIGCKVSYHKGLDDPFDSAEIARSRFVASYIPPKKTDLAGPVCQPMTDSDLKYIDTEMTFVYVCGVAQFQDRPDSSTWHETQFCRRIMNPNVDSKGIFRFIWAGVGVHNCVDDDCPGYRSDRKPFNGGLPSSAH